MTLPWQEWADSLKYTDKKSMLEGLYTDLKSIQKMAGKLGVEPQVVRYQMQKEGINYLIKKPGGPNHTGPNYKELKWITDTISKKKLNKMTIREIMAASGKEFSRNFRHSLYRRLLYYGITYKKGKMGRPKGGKNGQKRHDKN